MAGKTAARGYGWGHQKLRRWWAPQVARGDVSCARCGSLIQPGTPWDLGHEDHDRAAYAGPEHRRCNRRTMAHRAQRRARAGVPSPRSRDWYA